MTGSSDASYFGSPRRLSEEALKTRLVARGDRLVAYIQVKTPAKYRSWIPPEDVLQEVWISAFRGLDSFREDSPDAFDRWLATLAQHRILDAIKTVKSAKRGRGAVALNQGSVHSKSCPELVAEVVSPGRTPSRETSARELSGVLQSALRGLPQEMREVMRLRHFEGRSPEEIAAILGKPIGTVRTNLFRGLKLLRSELGDEASFFTDVNSQDSRLDDPRTGDR